MIWSSGVIFGVGLFSPGSARSVLMGDGRFFGDWEADRGRGGERGGEGLVDGSGDVSGVKTGVSDCESGGEGVSVLGRTCHRVNTSKGSSS